MPLQGPSQYPTDALPWIGVGEDVSLDPVKGLMMQLQSLIVWNRRIT